MSHIPCQSLRSWSPGRNQTNRCVVNSSTWRHFIRPYNIPMLNFGQGYPGIQGFISTVTPAELIGVSGSASKQLTGLPYPASTSKLLFSSSTGVSNWAIWWKFPVKAKKRWQTCKTYCNQTYNKTVKVWYMILPNSRRINRSTTSCLQGLTRNKRFFIGNAQCQTWREVRNGSLRFPFLEVVNRKEQCNHVIIAWCSEGKCMKYDKNPRGTRPSSSLLHLYLPQHPPESARQRPVFWCVLPRSSRRIWHVLYWVCYGSLILTEESDLKTTNPLKQIETLE